MHRRSPSPRGARARRGRTAAFVVGVLVAAPPLAATAISACSVTLDTSRLNTVADSSAEAGPLAAYRSCSQDSDCTPAAGGCVSGHCGTAPDGTPNVCLFDECSTGNACVAASCTSGQCGAAAPYHFNAGSFAIDAGIACSFSGNYQYYQAIPPSCVAAVFPFLFIRTTTSILAFDVADPTTSSPPSVAFPPLPFTPRQMFTTGRRIYFVSDTASTASDALSVTIAWLDVPLDPSLRSLAPTLTPLFINRSNLDDDTVSVLPGPSAQIFVIVNDYAKLIAFPPADPTAQLQLFKMVSLPQNSYFAGSSGTSLVTFGVNFDSNGHASSESLSLETGAGTATSLNTAATSGMEGTYGALQEWTQASADNGALVISGVPLGYDDGGGAYESQVQVGWVLPNGGASSFNVGAGSFAVLSQYPFSYSGGYEGPVALSDPNTAIAVAYSQTDKTSEVFVVTSDGGANPQVGTHYPLSSDQQSVALAASNGFAYIVEPETVDTATVLVFAPSCQ